MLLSISFEQVRNLLLEEKGQWLKVRLFAFLLRKSFRVVFGTVTFILEFNIHLQQV